MNYCESCIESLYPDDPRFGTTIRGEHLVPLCRYCPRSNKGEPVIDNLEARVSYLENLDKQEIITQYSKQLEAQMVNLKKIVYELRDKKKKKGAEIEI